MRFTRTAGTALAGITLAAALAGCGQASAPKPPASTPAASVAACTKALEAAGENAIVQGAASGGTYPAAVNRACDGLSATAMNTAVNAAMGKLTGTSS
jgi:hypothetical protein